MIIGVNTHRKFGPVGTSGDRSPGDSFRACYLAGMEDQGRWEGPFQPGNPDGPELTNRTYQSNVVDLYTDGKEICAMIGPDPVQGISGYGASAHEALRDLADHLVKFGVWIEVTDLEHPWRGFREDPDLAR